MLGIYLTTAINFLADGDTPTISDGMGSIWKGLGDARRCVRWTARPKP